jgi:pimeloyl-ACP methyl ester carboxylesterase
LFVEINGDRLHTVSFGDGDKTILAHGGFMVGWEMWVPIFELLSKRWRCVSYDHRGVGQSRVPLESITDDTIIDDVFGVMDKLEIEKCVLVGESMGGRVAINAVLRHPERFDGLILIASPSRLKTRMSDEEFTKQQIMFRQQYEEFVTEFVTACFPEPNSDHLIQWGIDICFRTKTEEAIRYLRIFEGPDEDHLDLPLSRIAIPTLIIHGKLDNLVPLEEAKILASSIPNAELRIFENAGHAPSVSQPHKVVRTIEEWFTSLT